MKAKYESMKIIMNEIMKINEINNNENNNNNISIRKIIIIIIKIIENN